MALLAPALLWGLIAGPILLFFYVWRARHRRFVAPSVLLWQQVLQETEHRPSWRLPIRHILLLLQLLALALLAFALARPAVSLGVPHHDVVVVDASLAMTALDVPPQQAGASGARPQTRLAAAQEALRGMIDRLRPADTLTLIRAGSVADVLTTSGDHEVLRRAVDGLRADLSAPALGDSLLLAADLLQAPGATASLTVLTSRDAVGAEAACRRAPIPCRLLRFGTSDTSDDDVAVSALSATCPAGQGDCTVFASIVNNGSLAVGEPVRLFADGQPLPLSADQSTYTVGAHSSLDLVFSAPRQARMVELSLARQDILAADDRRWAVLPHPHTRSILVVSDDPTVVDRAVHVLPDVSVSDVTPADYASTDTRGVDMVIYDNWAPDAGPDGNALVIDPPQSNAFVPYAHMMGNPAVAAIDTRTSLAQTLLDGVDLGALLVAAAPALSQPSWAQALVSSNAGPLILAGTRGAPQGTTNSGEGSTPRVVVIGFALESSNLPRLLAFPLFLARVVDWLAGPATDATAGTPAWGSTLSLAEPPASGASSVVDPAGHAVALPAGPSDGAPLFVAQGTPGPYEVRPGGTLLLLNAGAATADGAPPSVWAAGGAVWRQVREAIARQEVWWAVLLGVLAVLSLEWWIYARRT